MDTKVFDIYSDGIGKKKRHLFRGYDTLKELEDWVRACGVQQPNMLIATVVATLRNVLDDELEAQAEIAKDLEAELN